MRLIGIFGASGHGREVMPILCAACDVDTEIDFIDDDPAAGKLNGADVLGWDAFMGRDADDRWVSIAIADSAVRETLALRCECAGCKFLSVRAANVVIMDGTEISSGDVLSPFVTITSNVTVGGISIRTSTARSRMTARSAASWPSGRARDATEPYE